MNPNHIKSRLTEIILFLITFVAGFSVFLFGNLKFPNDDQFILFRYIDNIASGNGFVYNIGEHVLGATTPLFTMVAAFAKYVFFFVSTPNIVAALNMIFISLAAVVFYWVSREFISKKLSIFVTVIFALNMTKTIPEGMETPLFLFTAFSLIFCLLKGKYYTSSIFLALTILTRPDAGLIALLVGCFWWQKEGLYRAIRYSLIALVVTLPWLLFSTLYFGSFVPQSLQTKIHSHDIYNLSALQAVKIQLASLSRIYWGKMFDPENILQQVVFNLLPFIFLAFLGTVKMISRDKWVIFAIPVIYFISFSLSNPIMFPWYLSQMEPFWILISFFGFVFLLGKINKPDLKKILLVLVICGSLFSWGKLVTSSDEGSKMNAFKVGNYIKSEMLDSDTVGLADIGIVGYITNAHIIDFIGLVNSDSVYFYPIRDDCVDKKELYVIPPEIILQKKPNWLVAGDSSLEKCFVESDWFKQHYDFKYQSGGAKVWRFKT